MLYCLMFFWIKKLDNASWSPATLLKSTCIITFYGTVYFFIRTKVSQCNFFKYPVALTETQLLMVIHFNVKTK